MLGLNGHVVGREQELAAIERLLTDAREGFAALLLEGEAGMGKTTVFHEALRIAEGEGFHVLTCRAGASEATLSLAAIGDLLEGAPAECWSELPGPQRRALDVTLLRIDPGDVPVDQRAVAAGLRSLVNALAAQRPVLLAVDDVQWLDPTSAVILTFVLRRLGPESVGVLATRRLSEEAKLDLVALAPPDRLARVQLGPLSLGALQRTLRDRLGVVFPRSMLVRVHAASHGNPLFALEIGRILAEGGAIDAGEPLPVPDDLRELVRARVAALPAGTRDLLLAAALLAQPAVETLVSALERPLGTDLDPAERAGIAALDGDLIAFAHPLHAAAVIATATTAARRRMHRKLAEAVADLEERARHLALGADGPDETISKLLDDGAAVAQARGGLSSAAELLEWARKLTPSSDVDAARARGIRAAEFHFHAGDPGRASRLLHELLAQTLPPSQRAEALRLLAELSLAEEDPVECERLLVEALEMAPEPGIEARIQTDLLYVVNRQMDFQRSADHGHQALAILTERDPGPLLAEALAYSAMADYLVGRGVDWKKVERALELEDASHLALPGLPPGGVAACLMMYVGRHGEARELMGRIRDQLSECGAEADLAQVLLWQSWLETRSGNLDTAAEIADEGIVFAELAANRSFGQWIVAQRAWVDAHLGRIVDARRGCAEALGTDRSGIPHIAIWIAATLALAELSVGDPEAAWEGCRPIMEAVEQSGIAEPVPLMCLPDALEALIALGHLDRAEALLDTFERRGRDLDRIWALATGGRCRGLLLAARGDLGGASEALDRALVEHERIDLPFERARTLLVKGMTERRLRRRTAARRTLDEAVCEFERMGSPLWADRARTELGRVVGSRTRGENELTPSEQRVVELAAEGLSNKEIAGRLVVGVHTVEVHLSHAYEKLGVHSRSQLASHLSREA